MRLDKELTDKLGDVLKQPLPGEEAHRLMSPPYRPMLSAEQIQANNPKTGAVLLLLYERSETLYLVFTLRKAYEGVHGGQMSFPGGKKDVEDTDLIQTALRETLEEIGIAAEKVTVLGQLSKLYIPPSNFLVYPVVGYGKDIGTFLPQQSEVEAIVEIPVDFLLDPANVNPQTEIKLYTGSTVQVPAYVYKNFIIWGATAIITSEFVTILKKIAPHN